MKGAALLGAVVLCAALSGSLADKAKPLKKFPQEGPPPQFLRPLPLPPVPPFRLAPVTQASSTLDPYACLPKYLCIVENKKGEKRTTIVHGLHPALRKAKPNVIDPSTLPQVSGGTKPFIPPPFLTEAADDDIYRDREFNDGFLQQQDMAEAMAFLEEKRRQFLYQQGRPTQKIIPKGSRPPIIEAVEEEDKKSKESAEEESKEEKSKEEEVSKEDKEEKSVETSKEAEKSVEVSKEEKEVSKEEKEEESAEDDASSEANKSRSKLSKYKIKKKLYSKLFKARADYDDADTEEDRLATVPWDDRVKNDTDPLKPSEIYDKLFGKVLPSFQLPSLPKIAKSIPGVSFFTSGAEEVTTTTTTARPGFLRRMIKVVTGGSSSGTPSTLKKREGRPLQRHRRAADDKLLFSDAKIVKQIRDPARQCRMIFKGCDLPYDHIMKMVSRGQVLIENDPDTATTRKPAVTNPLFNYDDEAEQAIKDKMGPKKSLKPIPELLAQASLGGKKKTNTLPIFGKNKKKPSVFDGSSEESVEAYRPKEKKAVASLPLMPMKYHWGKPTWNGKPTKGADADFSGGIIDRDAFTTPATTTPTTTTTPRPIFGAIPLDKRDNSTTIPFQQSIIRLNKTHSVHVIQKKPYNPPKTRVRDAKGDPLSFSSVFTEIAGNTGGIHDFFDRISGAFGGENLKESGREFSSAFPQSNADHPERFPQARPTAFPKTPVDKKSIPDEINVSGEAQRDEEEASDEEEEEEEEEEEDDVPPGPPGPNDEEKRQHDDEEGSDEDEEEDEEEEEDDTADNANEETADDANEETADDANEESADDANDETADEVADDVVEELIPDKKKKPEEKQPEEPILSASQEQEQEEPIFPKKKEEKNKNKKMKPSATAAPEEEEEEEEEEGENKEDDDLDENGLPDNIPPFIKQSMIEDMKRRKKEKENGGGGGQQGQGQQQGGGRPGGPGGRPQQFGGGQYPQQGQPPRGGGFLSWFG